MKIARIASMTAAAALAAATIPASAAIITFNNLDMSGPFSGNGQPFTTYSEAGFMVSAPTNQYVKSTTSTATPSLLTGQNNATANALLTITGTGLFTFSSFDAFASVTAATYTVTGYVGATQVYANSGTVGVPGTYGTFSTYSGFNNAAVDRITIATVAPYQLFIDNVTTGIAATAVPEPASWAMMIAGVGVVGGAIRRRRTRSTATRVAYA